MDFRLLFEEEDAALYDDLATRVIEAVKPADVIEEMLVADVIYLQWEVIRWRRLKFALMQASVHEELRAFLKQHLDYNTYAETFVESLVPELQELLAKSPDQVRELAYACARGDQGAVDEVNELLGAPDVDRIQDEAQDHAAKQLVKAYAQRDQDAVRLVDELLAANGRTIDELMLAALFEKFGSPEKVDQIDRQITSAEVRRNVSLREIDRHRAVLGEALRQTLPQVEGDFKVIESRPSGGKRAA